MAVIIAGAWVILKLPQQEKAPISDAGGNEQLLNTEVPAAPSNKSNLQGNPPSQLGTNADTDALKIIAIARD